MNKPCLNFSYKQGSRGWWLAGSRAMDCDYAMAWHSAWFIWKTFSSDRINQPWRLSSLNRKKWGLQEKKKKLMQSKSVLNRTTAIYLFSALLQGRFKGTVNNSVQKQIDKNLIPLLLFRQPIEESPNFHKNISQGLWRN